ncbi:hypothetical protein ACHAW5_002240 [Stephanodiscus triporus]|uniref:Peptidase M11 gametolysin domain-containing protein n=1 Tax=Stephanodiscus triporus TaxID=2934178 RepID=A0ABD3QLQ0_9STRA
MTCVAGTVGLSRSRILCVALSSFYAATTNAVVLGAATESLSSPSDSYLRGLKRDRSHNVPKSLKAHTCTIEVVMLAPDGSTSIEGKDEVYQCTINPGDVPGGYTGLTRKLDLRRTQKRALKKMWKEGRLVPGQTQLKLANIEEATMSEEVAEAVDEMTVAKEDMLEGVPIDVSDIQIPTVLDVEELLVDGDVNHARELQTSFGSHVGIKPTLVVKVFDVNNKARSESPMEISDDIFGTNGDPVNLRSQMSACSMGRVDFVPGDNNYGIDQSLYDAPGVITVKIEISLENNTRTGIENAITAKVQDKLQMTLPGPYKHVMYIVEKCYVNCGYAAYAYVNKYISVYQGENYKYVGVLMHEIGHNFGLVSYIVLLLLRYTSSFMMGAHSGGKDGVHGANFASDISFPRRVFHFPQGDPYYQDDTGKMCYNPAKNWQIGWYNDRKMMLTPHSETSGWETIVTIVGIADYQKNTRFPVVLKLETGAANDYFIGFNRAAEINSDNKEADDQLTIVLSGSHGESYSQSWLKATLQVSEQYMIKNFGGVNGMDVVIILDSIDEPGDGSWQANVKVIKSEPTVNPTLKADKLKADKLKADKLKADKLKADKLKADKLKADKLKADKLKADKLKADKLKADKLKADKLKADKLNADKLKADKVKADRALYNSKFLCRSSDTIVRRSYSMVKK